MIILNLTGGLGNQMFQYALGRHLAIKNNKRLKLHYTNALFNTQRRYELDVFNVKIQFATDDDLKQLGIIKNRVVNRILYLIDERFKIKYNRKVITEAPSRKFNPSIFKLKDNIYLQGFWNNEKYFKTIESVLRKDFTLKKELDKKNKDILNLIKKTNSVSLHVRRTDFITATSNTFIGLNYYIKAIKQMIKKVKKPVFFVFSDDILWCRKHLRFPNKVYFINHNKGADSYKDMHLMSNCKHNIIANSTFSWWGGWLNQNNNKILIQP